MSLMISGVVERWPVAGEFVIARGTKTHVDVLVVGVSDGHHIGTGEGTAVYYNGESAESCLAQIIAIKDDLEKMDAVAAKVAVQQMLPAGAARNATDCALWDLAAKAAGQPLWEYAGFAEPTPVPTAFTISLGEEDAMRADAAKAAANGYGLLKLKLTSEGDTARVAAVRRGAPDARLIVDANESWQAGQVASMSAALAELGVEMIEQPVPRGQDDTLAGIKSAVPLITDESCHDASDVVRCASYYDGVNIKLDKAGGLTEAMEIADAADAAGLKIMLGCMLSTSLGIAPAFPLASRAHWVDLDGPALLAEDRENALRFESGMISASGC